MKTISEILISVWNNGYQECENKVQYKTTDVPEAIKEISELIKKEVIGEDLPTDIHGSWTRRANGEMIRLSDEVIVINNRNAVQRTKLDQLSKEMHE